MLWVIEVNCCNCNNSGSALRRFAVAIDQLLDAWTYLDVAMSAVLGAETEPAAFAGFSLSAYHHSCVCAKASV